MKSVYNLSDQASAVLNAMEMLRNVQKQGDRSRFRQSIRSIGRFIAYEISKTMSVSKLKIETPLASHEQRVLADEVVVVTVLRAGLPLHEGILDVFQEAENGFVSAYRKHDGESFHIEIEYIACPDLTGKVVIINDPMLATGQSMLNAWEALLNYGKPKRVILAAVIASQQGIDHVLRHAPSDFDLWVADVDPELNEHKYIVPGLGDAGDLAFGTKIQN
jgi:uracil phosphoribosyltransferase